MSERQEENAENKRNTVLRITSVRLEPSQIEFLKTLDNASEWIREAIDAKRLESLDETEESKTILLTKQIRKLELDQERLERNYEFVRAKKTIMEATRIRENYAKLLKQSPQERFNPILNLFAEFDPFIEAKETKSGICFASLFGKNKEPIIFPKEDFYHKMMLSGLENLPRIESRPFTRWRVQKEDLARLIDTAENMVKQKRSSMEKDLETSQRELQLAKKVSDAFNIKIERIQNEIEGLEQRIRDIT